MEPGSSEPHDQVTITATRKFVTPSYLLYKRGGDELVSCGTIVNSEGLSN